MSTRLYGSATKYLPGLTYPARRRRIAPNPHLRTLLAALAVLATFGAFASESP